jgi:ABC-type dipeptide/oligopeptide/nickel transport system permease subunit
VIIVKNLFRTLWRIIRKDRLALAGSVFMVFIVLVALFAPIIATHDPNAMNYMVEGTALWLKEGSWRLEEGIVLKTLNSVAVSSTGEVIAVGDNGTIVRFSAGKWSSMDSSTLDTLNGVAYIDSFAVAVGENGTAVIFDGKLWKTTDSGVTENLKSVAAFSKAKALAVGESGTVVLWDGDSWKELVSGVSENLNDVALFSEDFGFVVGDRNVILAFDGENLKREMVMGFRALYGVDIFDTQSAIAVGERGTILRYNGRNWQSMFGPENRDINSIVMTGKDSAIVVGGHGVAMSLESGTWKKANTGYTRHLKDIGGEGNTVIAVGTDPYVNSLARPSFSHLFGTTHNGRDIFSQVVYGSRAALLVGLIAAVMVTLIGTNVGIIAGYFKGRTDNILMRIVDIMYALPLEPFAMILVLITRPGIGVIILSVGLLTWRTTARIIRSQVLSISARPFVKAARVAGASDFRIMYVHIAPNVLPLAFLQLAVAMAFAITAEATLSFLGLGPPRIYSWGTILHQARLSGAWRTAWWWIVPPGILIMLTVVSVFFISRALEVLTNPRLEVDRDAS